MAALVTVLNFFFDGWNAVSDIHRILGVPFVDDGSCPDYGPVRESINALQYLVATEKELPDEVVLIRSALLAHVARAHLLGEDAAVVHAVAQTRNTWTMLDWVSSSLGKLWN